MRTRFQTLKVVGFLLATGLVSGQAMAQASATADTLAAVLKPLTLTKDSDLNFGVLLATTGTVTISPIDGARTFGGAGAASNAAGATLPTRAKFTVAGIPNATYSITALATTIDLQNTASAADKLTVTLSGVHSLTENKTGTAATGSTGTFSPSGSDTLGVGGTIAVASNTLVGNYANPAGIALTVNYN
jgi:hypothetical protein